MTAAYWGIHLLALTLLCVVQQAGSRRVRVKGSKSIAWAVRFLGGLMLVGAVCGLSNNYSGHIGLLLWFGSVPVVTLILSTLAALIVHRR